jgi:beta-galactosidase
VVAEGSALPAGSSPCDLWCDLINLEGATALATFGQDFYAGRPAVTEHRFGQGRALYVATRPDPTFLASLIGRLLDDLGIAAPLPAPSGVEVTRREGDGRAYTFVLNHGDQPARVALPSPLTDLLTGRRHEGALELPSRGVAILTAP